MPWENTRILLWPETISGTQLRPILPLDNLDPDRWKHEYGKRLCFEGGIDIEKILVFGSVEDVKKRVRELIDILGPGGGYLFKAQAISHLIPFENLITAYNPAFEYDGYAGA